jgi:hypothetical protein
MVVVVVLLPMPIAGWIWEMGSIWREAEDSTSLYSTQNTLQKWREH